MKQAKFYLESRKDKIGNQINEDVPIRLLFHFDGNRFEYYTQIRIGNAKNFNRDYFRTGKSFIKANEPEASRKNQSLKRLKAKVEALYDDAIALGLTPTTTYLREKLDEQFKGKIVNSDQKSVKEAFAEYLDYTLAEKSYRTWQKLNSTYNHLKKAYGEMFDKLTFDEVNTAFINKFKQNLLNTGYESKKEKTDYLNNTVVKYLQNIRKFLNWCKDEERGYYTGNAKFEKLQENDINVIYLNLEEIKRLQNSLMPSETLHRVRDVFLFGCYTGLRYSDIVKLKKKDVLEDEIRFYITKDHQATWHRVPLVEQSRQILSKYKDLSGDKALPVLSAAKTNEYLKSVMKIAAFNEILTIREKKANGVLVEKEYQKWELITCHTSRKSFISFAVEASMPELEIKAITGHSKNSRAFAKYYEVSEDKKRKAMEKIFSVLQDEY
jgi:integrase